MEKSITLYLTPYLRLYLLAKLGDLHRAAQDTDARQLWTEMSAQLGGRITRVVNDYGTRPSLTGRVELYLDVPDSVCLEPNASGRTLRVENAMSVLQRAYKTEMFQQVTWMRLVLGVTAREGLTFFRRRYSITEEDYAFLSEERLYQKHCHRLGLTKPRRRVERSYAPGARR